MKKYFIYLLLVTLAVAGCKKDSDFLNVQPLSILDNETAFSDAPAVLSILANFYNRLPDVTTVKSWTSMADFSETFPSENGQVGIVQRNSWNYDEWGLNWFDAYAFMREINLFLVRCEAAKALSGEDQKRFIAEGRFLRAYYYFEMVKRLGGVPLILESLEYDLKGDPTYLQHPRAKEHEVYDFIISETEAIKNDLPANSAVKGRVSKGAALAMQTRAALYAASIAKYGASTAAVSLPGGEVGIPAAMADAYYAKALTAAKQIIEGEAGAYDLYNLKPDLADNYASTFLDKASNPESIFIEDFRLRSGKVHYFTGWNQPRYGAEEEEGGRLNPSLNLVHAFERTDNTFAPLPISDGAGNPIFYDHPTDLFAGRDARLAGTVITPGSTFRGRAVEIWAGYQLGDGTIISGDDRGVQRLLPGSDVSVQVVGMDGPVAGKEFTAQSGFYIRKYLDPTPGAGSRGTNSEVPFQRYRFAEVLLNAAEAAFELSQADVAAGYMNRVRARAGLTIPLSPAEITFDRIVHERRVELAYEGHLLFDMKRWRLATKKWDGVKMSESQLLSNLGSAERRNTQPYSLWPYRYHNPGNANHGKWLFKIVLLPAVTGANNFQLGNYYSRIVDNVIASNPLIVRQPNQ